MVDERSADDHRDREAPDVEVDSNGAVELSSETAPPRPWWSLAGSWPGLLDAVERYVACCWAHNPGILILVS